MDNSELRRTAREAFRQMDEASHLTLDQIAAFAKGELPESRHAAAAHHLMECASCRERHAEFAAFLADSGEPPAANLDAEWRDLKRRIRRKKVIVMPRWWGIAAAIFAVLGLSYFSLRWIALSPSRLLAQAYHERRSSEFRLAGAAWAPVTQERGGGSAFSLPSSLLTAQAHLADELKTTPDDPDRLRLRGEAEMIARDAAAAVQTLQRAYDVSPKDPAILADLGAAYALRGDLQNHPADYWAALDFLGRSLQLVPRNPEAVFNQALVLERLLIYDQAVRRWEEFLAVDSTSAWAAEARRHLGAIQPKVKARRETAPCPVDPAGFLALNSELQMARAEDCLREAAVTVWLPAKDSNPDAARALSMLAEALQRKHGDTWLADLLATNTKPQALANLAEARSANRRLDGKVAQASAQQASGLFLRSSSLPGSLWARFEHVVSLRNLAQHDACVSEAEALTTVLDSHPYYWLRAETRIESANCAMRDGRLDYGANHLRQASVLSAAAGLGEVQLRADGIYLDPLIHIGLPSEVYSKAADALRTFWNGTYPVMRFYQVVSRLKDFTHGSANEHAAYFLARSTVWAIESLQPPIVQDEAIAYGGLAAAAQTIGAAEESRRSWEISDRLFAASPSGRASEYYVRRRTALALAMLETGDATTALGFLEDLCNGMDSRLPVLVEVLYRAAFGEALRQKGRLEEAAAEFQRGIQTGIRRLSSLSAEREKSGVLQSIESSYRGLVSATLHLPGGDREALRLWKEYRELDTVGSHAPNPAGSDPVLTLLELPDGLAGWLQSGPSILFRRLDCTRTQAAYVISRFARTAGQPDGDRPTLQRDARQLYEWLLQPFGGLSTGPRARLVVELDGVLAAIPIRALVARDGRTLGEMLPVLSSTGYGRGSPGAFNASSARLLIVANPAIGGDGAARFPPLPDSLREAQAASSVFRASTTLTGPAATIDALTTNLAAAEIVHFAGHGYVNGEGGALLFSPKDPGAADYDLLHSAALLRQDWSHCRLAVLSACATAAGATRGSSNPENLVRALTRAGTSRVLASLWNVDSAATSTLMREFYGALARGSTPEESLRSAQAAVRGQPRWTHPYYWAGFQLYGTI